MRLECGCPSEYPGWDNQDINLTGQCVHRLPIASFLHMPLSYEAYTHRQQNDIELLELKEPWPGFTLTRTGAWGGEILRLLEEGTESPSRRVSYIPAGFNVRVILHNGGIGTIKNTLKDMQMALLEDGKMPKELYLAHLTCPQCEEKQGGEKIMLVRRWVVSKRLANRKRKPSTV